MTEQYLEIHQHGPAEPSPYERKLAGIIEEIFGRGVHDLPAVVGALNDSGSTAPDGRPWTEETFVTEMERLGA